MFEIVERADEGDSASYAYDIFIAVTAVLSITPLLLRVSDFATLPARIIQIIDIVTVYILLGDYFMRWMTHDMRCKERGHDHGWHAFLVYPFRPMAIIDLISLLPTLIVMPEMFRFLRLLRLLKLFRVLRSLSIVGNVFIREGRTLLSVLVVVILYVFSAALVMYCYEPQTFSTFLEAFYWAMTALATIGYGDLYPQTDVGKIVSIVSTVVGIVVVALPAGIITGGYVSEMRRMRLKGKQHRRAIDVQRLQDADALDGARAMVNIVGKRKITRYFRRNPKVGRYLAVMVAAWVVDLAMMSAFAASGYKGGFNYVGTAVAAALLEPAAGICVGFCTALAYSVIFGSVTNVFYFFGNVVIAIGFGMLLHSEKGLNPKRILKYLAVLSLVTSLIDIVIYNHTGADDSTAVMIASGIAEGDLLGGVRNAILDEAVYFLWMFGISAAMFVFVWLAHRVAMRLSPAAPAEDARAAEPGVLGSDGKVQAAVATDAEGPDAVLPESDGAGGGEENHPVLKPPSRGRINYRQRARYRQQVVYGRESRPPR